MTDKNNNSNNTDTSNRKTTATTGNKNNNIRAPTTENKSEMDLEPVKTNLFDNNTSSGDQKTNDDLSNIAPTTTK